MSLNEAGDDHTSKSSYKVYQLLDIGLLGKLVFFFFFFFPKEKFIKIKNKWNNLAPWITAQKHLSKELT